MKLKILFLIGIGATLFQGCLVYQKVSYLVSVHGGTLGEATVTFYDIKSDALGKKEFNEDKETLFNRLLKSEEFLLSQKEEGKEVVGRKLFLSNKKLNGEVTFKYKDIDVVEGIQFQDGYYFLTVQAEDSIVSTNGTIIPTPKFKRIIWDKDETQLKFEMLTDVNLDDLREMAPYYKEDENGK